MSNSKITLVIASILVLIACRGSGDSTSPLKSSPEFEVARSSESDVGGTLWGIAAYNAEVAVLSSLMPCITAWNLDLADKVLSTRYLGRGRWVVQVSFENSSQKPYGGDLGSWKAIQPIDQLIHDIEEVLPYDEVAEAIVNRPKKCFAPHRIYPIQTIEEEVELPYEDGSH